MFEFLVYIFHLQKKKKVKKKNQKAKTKKKTLCPTKGMGP